MRAPEAREHGRLFEMLASWWREARRRRTDIEVLDRGAAEAEAIASDVGISAAELRMVAGRRTDAARLLRPRLASLGMDRASLQRHHPEVMRDLERVCSLCGAKMRCERDLATSPADPRWRRYCPNVPTLDALQETCGGSAAAQASKALKLASPCPAAYRGFAIQRGQLAKR